MEKKVFLSAILLIILPLGLHAQQIQRPITLAETIALARVQSLDAAVALNELKTSYWEYRTFRADLLPERNLTGTLPNYNKSYNAHQSSDGSYSYVRNNSLGMYGELSIDQNIWFTGGRISLISSIDFLNELSNDNKKNFMSIPIAIRLNQPIFGVNNIKWNRRIEPVRYEEAKARFISETEQVTITAINYFFNLLLAKEKLATAIQNQGNAEHLYKVAQARRQMGQISENELLQLKLNSLQAKASVTENESNLNANMFRLRSFLGISETEILEPVVPESAPNIDMVYEDVLGKALERNSFSQNILRRQLEAEYAIARAKGDLRSISLFATIGFTGKDQRFYDAYQNLHDNQVVQLGLKIPLVDWGKRRGKVKVAESNREVVESRLKQEQMNFNQDIFLLVANFNNQAAQLNIATEADQIAQQRYKTSIESFLIGQINTLDLNDAQNSKDQARQNHIEQMLYYWSFYYRLRSLTLWDFEKRAPLEVDFEEVIKR